MNCAATRGGPNVPLNMPPRRGVIAVAFAACIMVGTLTGAQLKQDQQKAEVRVLPSSPTLLPPNLFLHSREREAAFHPLPRPPNTALPSSAQEGGRY